MGIKKNSDRKSTKRASSNKGEPPKWEPKIRDSPKFNLTSKQKEELYTIFEMLDDGTGAVKVRDLQALLKSANLVVDDMEMKRLFKGVRTDKITAEGLVQIMENKLMEDETKTDLKRIFGAFDYENRGYVSYSNLKRLAHELKIDLTDEELREMIEEADTDQDGVVNEDDFIQIMLKMDL